MGKRREGREATVQFLCSCDLNEGLGFEDLERFWDLRPATRGVQEFAISLIRGAIENRAAIDERIIKYTANYELDRLATVDRNILRLAIYEMLFRDDIPPVVSINEAIELAKNLGSEDSGRFVNGILDRVKLELARPLRSAADADASRAPAEIPLKSP